MGKFPEYPSDEEGGSAVIFDPELQAQYRGEMVGRADSDDSEDEEDGGGKKDKEKEKKAGAEGKKGDADKKGAKEEEEDQHGFKLGRSEFVKGLREADREFHGEFPRTNTATYKFATCICHVQILRQIHVHIIQIHICTYLRVSNPK